MILLEGCCVYIDSCSSVSLFQDTYTSTVEMWDVPWRQQRQVTNVTWGITYPHHHY